MDADIYPSDEYESGDVAAWAPARLSTPRDVLSDRTMSTAAKRALLASWASDLRAVENRPPLRRLDDGTELQIDDILDALKALDSSGEPGQGQSAVLPFPSHRLAHVRRRDRSDDEDDPPPAPAALGLPKASPSDGGDAFMVFGEPLAPFRRCRRIGDTQR